MLNSRVKRSYPRETIHNKSLIETQKTMHHSESIFYLSNTNEPEKMMQVIYKCKYLSFIQLTKQNHLVCVVLSAYLGLVAISRETEF